MLGQKSLILLEILWAEFIQAYLELEDMAKIFSAVSTSPALLLSSCSDKSPVQERHENMIHDHLPLRSVW